MIIYTHQSDIKPVAKELLTCLIESMNKTLSDKKVDYRILTAEEVDIERGFAKLYLFKSNASPEHGTIVAGDKQNDTSLQQVMANNWHRMLMLVIEDGFKETLGVRNLY